MKYDCPKCGNLLKFEEQKSYLYFSCENCTVVIVIEKNESNINVPTLSTDSIDNNLFEIYVDKSIIFYINGFKELGISVNFYPDFCDFERLKKKIEMIKVFK